MYPERVPDFPKTRRTCEELVLSLKAHVGRLKEFEEIIESTIDLNEQNKQGNTILHFAVGMRYPVDLIKSLLRHGADVNIADINGDTALIGAIKSKNVELLIFLLEIEAIKKNHINKQGENALSLAIKTANPQLIDLLKEKNAQLPTIWQRVQSTIRF